MRGEDAKPRIVKLSDARHADRPRTMPLTAVHRGFQWILPISMVSGITGTTARTLQDQPPAAKIALNAGALPWPLSPSAARRP